MFLILKTKKSLSLESSIKLKNPSFLGDKGSFYPHVSSIWNDLPQAIVNILSLEAIKSPIQAHHLFSCPFGFSDSFCGILFFP